MQVHRELYSASLPETAFEGSSFGGDISSGDLLADAASMPEITNELRTRSGRRLHPTWKVRDSLPTGPGGLDIQHPESTQNPQPLQPSRRILLLVTEKIRTVANRFSLSFLYKRRPS
ncbi:hypothetical protein SCP_1202700 [Sparassis crispa]|uniref:Uncharacterized protein n=1 Tax=Sparassis crispa TaxID=139825 RepID=A0A401H0W2_9APHY|nr:hypothetical protein SCP_1202700 [Sparassis crispa]GBE88042.1 hypothetical protein SCP_1202700 [Sparassis crispa]